MSATSFRCASCRSCPGNNARSERLEALDQDHGRAVSLHLHAIEEAHAEQREIQPAVEDHGIDVVHLDAAHAHRVELDVVDRDRPVCGAGHAALAAAIVEPQALGLAPRQRDPRRARLDPETPGAPGSPMRRTGTRLTAPSAKKWPRGSADRTTEPRFTLVAAAR